MDGGDREPEAGDQPEDTAFIRHTLTVADDLLGANKPEPLPPAGEKEV